jgi:tripartite-type tricarboxylate transporter receptor subunit TctC
MQRRQLLQSAAAGAALAAASQPLWAQGYPAGAVTVVLPLQAGSASDVAVRFMTERLASRMNAAFVVENVTGAAGLLGLERLARAPKDGQTIAALNNSIVTILPHLQPRKIKVDTRKDFVPIAGIANIPTFLGVRKDSPIKNVKDLIAAAKREPDKLTYASGGVGSPQHLATEMFRFYTGTQLTHVPYKGASQATVALASGEVDVMMIALSLAQPFLPDARVRLIGYCGPERHAQFRDMPTLREQGVADFDYSSWIALFVHKDTPAAAVAALRKEANAIAKDPELERQLIRSGMDAWPRNPAQLATAVQQDYERWGRIVTVAKLQGE